MPSTTRPFNPNSSTTLPPPSTFDILPALHALLSRLLPDYPDPAKQLSLKKLAEEASAIKIKIQKARVAVEMSPGVERTVEEQDAEIRELEETIQEQREMLRRLAEAGTKGLASKDE